MKRGADDLEWVEMETAQVEALYQERVTKDFPEAERRPLERILSFRQQGFYRCFLLCQGESWLGYAFCAQGEPESIALLDYYAMRPGLRGQGYGAKGLKLLADRQNQLLVALCRPEGYDVGGGEGLSYLVPLSVAVFDQSGALVRQIDTGCRVSESVKNYAYVPDARLENGQLLVEVQNLEADGSVTSQWAAIDYLEGESVS